MHHTLHFASRLAVTCVVSLQLILQPVLAQMQGNTEVPITTPAVQPSTVQAEPLPSTQSAEASAATATAQVLAGEAQTIRLEEAEVTVPAAALAQSLQIRLQVLADTEMAPLDAGLVNVSKGPHHGWRMLPNMKFKAHVKLKLPFDKKRIPEGYAEKDVRLFYFDTEAGRWMRLPQSQADSATGLVQGETDHFTDFIAGVVVAPDSPQMASYNATQFKDMKAADPSAKINLIEAPQASAMGDAALSYPLELPGGRQGMAPSLALHYASGAGNGWAGLGWSLAMPEVTIDTRWGVPRYSASEETETYLWNGQQLTPLAHRGALVPRVAERVFQARVEGGFHRIVRHGNSPANYWWEVTDKNGTRYAYGGDLASGRQRASAVLADDSGNVFRWALTEVRDSNGNRVDYSYTVVNDTGLALGSVVGRQLYPQTIRYTGDGAGPGPFEVRFIRDRDQPGFTPRRDRIIDGRGGFKMVTADLLRRVEVAYNSRLVRAYELEYAEGAFHKQLLRKIVQFDANNQAFNTHTLEYFDDARENGQYKGFAKASDWSSPNDNIELGQVIEQDASALSGHEGSVTGWHLYTGIGFGPEKQLSVGVKVGGNSASSNGRLLLIDLNGDGLPDKVFINGSGIYMRANQSGPNGQARFSAVPVQVANLPALMRETSSMSSRGLEAYLGLSAGLNWSDTATVSDIFFTDANGDGLPDLNLRGQILFNVLDQAGNPTFTANSAASANPVGPAVVDARNVQIRFDDLYQKLIDNAPLVDSVRSWTAPFAGQVQITGDLALRQDSSPARAAYQTADGVRVAIQHNGTELYAVRIAADDYTPKTPGLAPLTVAKGDVLYFRVQSVLDGAYDQVAWSPQISYSGLAPQRDANGLPNGSYDAAADFAAFSDKAPLFSAPFNGEVRVSATLNKTAQTTDDVRLELLKNGVVVASQTRAWNETGPLALRFDTPVRKLMADPTTGAITQNPDTLQLRLSTDSRIDLAGLQWLPSDMPRVWYTASTDSKLVNLVDASGTPSTVQPLPPQTSLFDTSNLTAPLAAWTATASGTVTVTPQIAIAGGNTGLNTSIVLTVKSGGALVAKRSIAVVNGAVAASSASALSFEAVAGTAYFFEFASASPGILAVIASSAVSLTLPNAQLVSAPSAFYGAEPASMLAQALRGWRSFGYNGNRERANQPIAITAADLAGPTEAQLTALKQQIDTAIANGKPDDALVLAQQGKLYPMLPGSNGATPPAARWTSGDADLWTEAAVQSASRYGANYIAVPDVSTFAGAQAAPRVSRTSQFGFTAGVSFLNGAASSSDSVSVLDFLDLNGDRFPDVVGSGGNVQFSPMVGGLEGASTSVSGMLSELRETGGNSKSFGIGGTFPQQSSNAKSHIDVTGSGGSTGNTGLQMRSLGVSGSFSDGDSDVRYDLHDINADGLPDVVRNDGSALWVRLNLGYKFAAEELYGTAQINQGESDAKSLGADIGFNDGVYGFGGGLNGSKSESRALVSIVDVNGDGLMDAVSQGTEPDTLLVRLNSGSGFEAPITWRTGGLGKLQSTSASVSAGLGGYFTIPICFIKFCILINPGADVGTSMSRLEHSIQDIDGNGFPDFLYSVDDAQLAVGYDTIGRTNLLKTVNRPLGSSITLAYQRSGNTQAQPQNKWVLSRTEVFDGFAGDGVDTLASTFAYEEGRWDRQEREFYGYARVTERHMNMAAPGGEALYRTVTRDFRNQTYYEKGLLERATTADAAGKRYLETANTWRLVDVASGTDLGNARSLTATVFPQLVRSDSHFYEGQPQAGKSTYQTFAYDGYGNVTRFTDAANLDTTEDDVESLIGYHQDLPAYIVGKAKSIKVLGNGVLMRERKASFEAGSGNLLQLESLLADGSAAVSNFGYDTHGSLVSVTGPANQRGQRYQLRYALDPEVATYVTQVTDSFGYASRASYDVRFGAVLTAHDLNNQPTVNTLDAAGRVVTVQGPYQAGSDLATLRFAYHPKRNVPGDARYEDVPVSWALTQHLDVYRNPADPVETVLFVDGLRRVLQTKQDATIYSGNQAQDRMVASGRITFDFVGRQVRQHYPVEEALGQAGVFNPAYDPVAPTVTDYDVLDRTVRVTIPDGTATTMAYGFGADREGRTQFHTKITDAKANVRETLADVRKLTVGVIERNPAGGQPMIWTSYGYDPLKQIVAVKDDRNNLTTAAYDNLGRMTALTSPDAGRTDYRFDLASNLVAKQTGNLRAQNQAIAYGYDYNRLATVSYPQYPGNNVSYSYGAPGAADNRANRITQVTSQGGIEERFYGPLGEVVKQIRTVNSDTQGNSANSPEVYTTQWTYDTWNRLQKLLYPDGELLTNLYDAGGRLRKIDGVKAGVNYPYLAQLGYDKFGQRVYLEGGNGTQTRYAYVPTTRRLDKLDAQSSKTRRTFQQLSYEYDVVGNITGQANAAAVKSPNEMGGATSFSYQYDDLYRLTAASGTWNTKPNKRETYSFAMGYDTIHNIVSKKQQHLAHQPGGPAIEQQKTSYDWAYTYGGAQPHAASQIGQRAFSYDANGNQTGWSNLLNGTRRTIEWDEENRVQAVSDNGHRMAYKYDDAGERIIKRGPQGETAYINQFYTQRNRELGTKHIFAGPTRLVSKLVKKPGVFEKDQYFFHPDHLGSSSYVTDADGVIFQHLEYFPFGETFVEESSNTQRTPYQFSGKELDEETGLYYFGARYYDPRTSVWQSADPILASYMRGGPNGGVQAPRNLSLYSYAVQHPVNLTDPNGLWVGVDDAVATGGGAAIGIAIQAGVDLWNGKLSSWKDYTAAAVSGAVTGEATLYAGPAAGGAAGGAAHALARRGLDGELPSAAAVAVSAVAGAVGGFVGGKIASRLGSGQQNIRPSIGSGAAEEAVLFTEISFGEKASRRSANQLYVNLTQSQAIENLVANGYEKTLSKSGIATIMTKGDKVYRFYPQSTGGGIPGASSGMPSASVSIEGKTVTKLRFSGD